MRPLKNIQTVKPQVVLRQSTATTGNFALNTRGRFAYLAGGGVEPARAVSQEGSRVLWEQPIQRALTCAIAEDGTVFVGETKKHDGPSMLLPIKPDGRFGRKRRLPVNNVNLFALAPDGEHLAMAPWASSSNPWIVNVHAAKEPAVECSSGHRPNTSLSSLAFTDCGTWLVSTAEEENSLDVEVVARKPGDAQATTLGIATCATVCGTAVATWHENPYGGELRIWQPGQQDPVRTFRITTPRPYGRVTSMTALQGGDHVALAALRALLVIDTASGEVVAAHDITGLASLQVALYASPDGGHVACDFGAARGPLAVYDTPAFLGRVRRRTLRYTEETPPAEVRALAQAHPEEPADRSFVRDGSEVRVSWPYRAHFQVVRGQGGEAQAEAHHFADQRAAARGYIAFVHALLDEGYTELAPWLTFRRGDEVLRLRPPVTEALETVVDGERRREIHGSVTEALLAYNALVRARTADGHAFVLPTWEASRAFVDDAFVEEIRYEEGDRVEKKWFHRVDDPSDEFGPELWFEQGRPWLLGHQLESKSYGPSFELRLDGPGLRAITSYDDGEREGPWILFAPDGSVEELVLQGDGYLEGVRFRRAFDASGRLRLAEAYGPDGSRVGTWVKTDDETTAIQQFRETGTCAAIRWERLDGTVALTNDFDESGLCVGKTFHDESGVLVERRVRHRNHLGWDMETFHPGGERVSARCILDEDEYRHGELTEYDEAGTVVGTSWWHHGEPAPDAGGS